MAERSLLPKVSMLLFVGVISGRVMDVNSAPANETAGNAQSTGQMAQQVAPLSASNSFNRLLKVTRRHQSPMEDSIHDPDNEAAQLLQPPLEAYANLPRTESDLGNGIDWVRAISENYISPRWDAQDPAQQPLVMDMNIIRVPRGSVPNVVFPHRQHTLWLDCSNCHPAIFIPQTGANQISMAGNLLGQKCGVCHGKVAFPFSECKRCHSQPKVAAGKGSAGR